MSFTEYEIPGPWGHICVKAWGNPSDTPVLLIHAALLNVNSFDLLIPLLTRGFYFCCIELPGHGRSSPLTPGTPLDFFYFVYIVKLVLDHLEWKKCILMGHCFGARLIMFFASLYPERVVKCIFIDMLPTQVTPEGDSAKRIRQYFDKIDKMSVASNTSMRSYTKDEAIKSMMKYRYTQINHEPAKIVLERDLVASGNGYRFTNDKRFRFRLIPLLTMDQMKHFIQNIRCPVLMLIAKDTYNLDDYPSEQLPTILKELFSEISSREWYETMFNILRNYECVFVEGNHMVQMNYPERLAPHINDFLLKSMESSS